MRDPGVSRPEGGGYVRDQGPCQGKGGWVSECPGVSGLRVVGM